LCDRRQLEHTVSQNQFPFWKGTRVATSPNQHHYHPEEQTSHLNCTELTLSDQSMTFISEEESRLLITHEIAFHAVKDALIAAAVDVSSTIFPAVVAHAAHKHDVFTIKSGTMSTISGLKVGSYWPDDIIKGQRNHNSTILLIDQASGRISSVVEAGEVNAYRTAAADAVAAVALARPDSSTLAIFGAGHQALFEYLALSRVLPIRHVLIVARDPTKAEQFGDKLKEHGLNASVASSTQEACIQADVVVTATPARTSLFEAAWIRPGTHIACMGADSKGKQEVLPFLYPHARLFCDLPTQSRTIGEFQHVPSSVEVIAIGDVLTGRSNGRESKDDITIFDSSGIALQDLFVAESLARVLDNHVVQIDRQ
jgi:ornithine cyclodeaminase